MTPKQFDPKPEAVAANPRPPRVPTLLERQEVALANIEREIQGIRLKAETDIRTLERLAITCREGIALLRFCPDAERIFNQFLESEIARRDKEEINKLVTGKKS